MKQDMIYCISKKLEISAAHSLQLSYESKCSRMHGHNWQLEIFLVSKDKLNEDGMVEDFTHIKKVIQSKMDHATLLPRISVNGLSNSSTHATRLTYKKASETKLLSSTRTK